MAAFIFQGNPKYFEIDTYLRECQGTVRWTVKPPRQIDTGDRAFIWRADGKRPGTGGIVAVGTVLSEPRPMPDDAPHLWKGEASAPDKSNLRVEIQLDEIRLTPAEGMILRSELRTHPVLSDLSILKYSAVYHSSVSPRQEQELLRLWNERDTRRG